MKIGARRLLSLTGLLAAVLGLGHINWTLATVPIAVDAGRAHLSNTLQADDAAATEIALKQARSIGDFTETTARPLFASTRRPAEPPPPPPAAVEPAPAAEPEPVPAPMIPASELQLLGVLIDESGRRALIRSPSKQAGAWVAVGEPIDGWVLKNIERDTAMIEAEGDKYDLKLYEQRPANPSAEAPQ